MDRAKRLLWNYVGDDGATTSIEYGLIASVISIGILFAVTQIGINLQIIFADVAAF